jgi:hypothetical protein
VNLSCNNVYLNVKYGIVLLCADCVLASPRIAQVDPGDRPPAEVVLSQSLHEPVLRFGYDEYHMLPESTEHSPELSESTECSSKPVNPNPYSSH